MNAQPVSALALCVLPLGTEEIIEDRLVQILAGIMTALRKENCALVGGHTSEGADLAIGLSINGIVASNSYFRKGPPSHGHVLILTKPLGTGVLLAANMRAKARGRWISKAIESMLQSNRGAAEIIRQQSCSACTDITGFGLIGHLLEMLKHDRDAAMKSKVIARIKLSQIPALDGAIECVQSGIFSTLYPQVSVVHKQNKHIVNFVSVEYTMCKSD